MATRQNYIEGGVTTTEPTHSSHDPMPLLFGIFHNSVIDQGLMPFNEPSTGWLEEKGWRYEISYVRRPGVYDTSR